MLHESDNKKCKIRQADDDLVLDILTVYSFFIQLSFKNFFKDVRGRIIPATWLFYNTTKLATRLNFSEKRNKNGKLNSGKVFNIYSIINSFLAAD